MALGCGYIEWVIIWVVFSWIERSFSSSLLSHLFLSPLIMYIEELLYSGPDRIVMGAMEVINQISHSPTIPSIASNDYGLS
jgi:hypothetical protein